MPRCNSLFSPTLAVEWHRQLLHFTRLDDVASASFSQRDGVTIYSAGSNAQMQYTLRPMREEHVSIEGPLLSISPALRVSQQHSQHRRRGHILITPTSAIITGPRGTTGPQGAPGRGPTGARGVRGTTGIEGITGPQGATGPQGPQGINATKGVKGSTGARGSRGGRRTADNAMTGRTGSTGPRGLTGLRGRRGFTGSKGATGVMGYTGAQGATGSPGPLNFTDIDDFWVTLNDLYKTINETKKAIEPYNKTDQARLRLLEWDIIAQDVTNTRWFSGALNLSLRMNTAYNSLVNYESSVRDLVKKLNISVLQLLTNFNCRCFTLSPDSLRGFFGVNCSSLPEPGKVNSTQLPVLHTNGFPSEEDYDAYLKQDADRPDWLQSRKRARSLQSTEESDDSSTLYAQHLQEVTAVANEFHSSRGKELFERGQQHLNALLSETHTQGDIIDSTVFLAELERVRLSFPPPSSGLSR
jgi:hypothetical protein